MRGGRLGPALVLVFGWWSFALSLAQAQTLNVVVSEIAWMGTTTDANDEWIELYNNTAAPINLSGWTLRATDGTPSVNLSGSIPAHGHFLLERTDDGSVPGIAADQIYTGALGNAGEILELRDEALTLQDRVDAWYAGSNATKATMTRVDPSVQGTVSTNWTNGPVNGTPMSSGSTSGCAAPTRFVDCQLGPPFQFRTGGPMVLNEAMINPAVVSDANGEYVELYNSGGTAVDLQGWTLRDDGTDSFTIPTGSPVLVPPGGFFLMASQADPGLNGGFTPDLVWSGFFLSNGGDEVVLLDASAVEQDRLVYAASPFTDSVGESVERVSPRLPGNDPLSWVQAKAAFGLGDRGTPRGVNTLQARRYVLEGTLVTMDDGLPPASQVFAGRLYVQGNRILDVLQAADPLPADAAGATTIVTSGLIFPGLMNIHDHLAFNTIPAWNVPALMQDVSDWTSLGQYQQYVRYPHEILTNAAYFDLLPEVGKYAEAKALMAGTTSEQGSFPTSSGFTGHLARNVDLSNFGADRVRQRSLSVLDSTFQTSEAPALVSAMEADQVDAWLVHLGEGTAEDAPAEFAVLGNVCLLRSETVIIHGTALTSADLDALADAGGKLVIAPTSNYLYYGATANVPGAVQRGIPVALSTDWSPAGDKNLLASLKSVALLNDTVWNGGLSDRQIVEMVTTAPAKALNWCTRVGNLRAGGFADLAVVAGDPALPYASLIAATEEDVLLTAVDGDPLYGRPAFLQALKPGDHEVLTSGCGFAAAIDVTDPAVLRGTQTFAEIQDLLQAASVFDFQQMKAGFKDPAVAGMTDPEFQAYLDQRFPLGILSRPLDPPWVVDDADYFDTLRNETNVTALDPGARLDIEPSWDPDGDTVLNACDCAPVDGTATARPGEIQRLRVLSDKVTFLWDSDAPASGSGIVYDLVRGGQVPVGSGEVCVESSSGDTAGLDGSVPAPAAPFFYLVRGRNVCAAGTYGAATGGAERIPSVSCP